MGPGLCDVEQRHRPAGIVFSTRQMLSRRTYDAPLKRQHLWCQTLPAGNPPDGRFKGGLAIFDALSPGAVDHRLLQRSLGHGAGRSSSFPTKWISPDGKTLHLVFSGRIHFPCEGQAVASLIESHVPYVSWNFRATSPSQGSCIAMIVYAHASAAARLGLVCKGSTAQTN
jgi:hypothetical protein